MRHGVMLFEPQPINHTANDVQQRQEAPKVQLVQCSTPGFRRAVPMVDGIAACAEVPLFNKSSIGKAGTCSL